MRLTRYELFSDVAETKNFTKSAERMGYTQPGVSQTLKALEEELGFSLFIRTRQGVALTPEAEEILPLVRKLLTANERLNQTVEEVNGLLRGSLTIATFASISRKWLPSVLSAFQQAYPAVTVNILEGGTDEIVGWVTDGLADFGILSRHKLKGLEWIPLTEDPLMAVLSKAEYEEFITGAGTDKPAAYPASLLSHKPFVISAEGTDYDIHHMLKTLGIRPDIRYSSKDDAAIVCMVEHGLGVTVLPRLVIDGVKGDVVSLPLDPYVSRELGIAVRSESSLSPAAGRFLKEFRESASGAGFMA